MSNKYLTHITLPNGERVGTGFPVFAHKERYIIYEDAILAEGRADETGVGDYLNRKAYNTNDILLIDDNDVFDKISPIVHTDAPSETSDYEVLLRFFKFNDSLIYEDGELKVTVKNRGVTYTFFDFMESKDICGEYWVEGAGWYGMGAGVFDVIIDGEINYPAYNAIESILADKDLCFGYVFDDEGLAKAKESGDSAYVTLYKRKKPFRFYVYDGLNYNEIPLANIVANSKENLPTDVPYHLPLGSKATVYSKGAELNPTEVKGVTEKDIEDYSMFIGNGGNAEDYKWDYDNIVNLHLRDSNLPTLNSDSNCAFTVYFMTPDDLMVGEENIKYASVTIEGKNVYGAIFDSTTPTEEEQNWDKAICTNGSWDYNVIQEFNAKVVSLNATTGMLIDDGTDLSILDEFVLLTSDKEVYTDYRLLKDGWVEDSPDIDITAIDAKIQENTDKIEEVSVKVNEIYPQVVNSTDELVNLDLPIGSIVSVKSYAQTYDKESINPLYYNEAVSNITDYYAAPVKSWHYTEFNSVEIIAGGMGTLKEWEIAIYFTDPKQAIFYNQVQTEFAKPVPTLILFRYGGSTVQAKFFDPNLTLEDYGEYGVEEDDGTIYAEAFIGNNATAASFFTNLINSQNYKTGFLYADTTLGNFTSETVEYIKFIKKGLTITDYRKVESDSGGTTWEEIPNINVINSALSDNIQDVKNVSSKILEVAEQVESNTSRIETINDDLNKILPADYLIQMAQNDGRLMCHDDVFGQVDIMTSADSYTTFLTRGGGCVLTQPIQAVWSTFRQPNNYQSMFAAYNYIDVIYSLPTPYYADDGTVDASGLFAGLSNLRKIDHDVLNRYESKITGARRMFYNCTNLRPLYLQVDFPNLKYVEDMFYNACTINSGYDENAYIKIVSNFAVLQDASRMFYDCAPMSIDLSQSQMPMVETADEMFYQGSTYGNPNTISLPTMPKITSINRMFYGSYVTTISSGLQNCENVTSITNAFYRCSNLTNLPTGFLGGLKISVSFSQSVNLTRESILNVINAVADLSAEGKTATLTLHATAKARLTEDDIAIATAKGWTIA